MSYRDDIAAINPNRTAPNRCNGRGYVQHFDDYWDCGGCVGCRPDSVTPWLIGLAIWRAANYEEHARIRESLRGFAGLAAIGRAIADASAVPTSLGRALTAAIKWWTTPVVNGWYLVTGTRGKAKAHHLKYGECVEVIRDQYQRGRWVVATTLTMKLLPRNGIPIWVPAGQVERIPPPPIAASREATRKILSSRPAWDGRKDELAFICQPGDHFNKPCRVMWISPDRKRVGVFIVDLMPLKHHQGDEKPVWLQITDLSRKCVDVGNERYIEAECAIAALYALCRLAKAATPSQEWISDFSAF